MNHKPKILFFSTGNATRSRMAAAFLRRKLGRECRGGGEYGGGIRRKRVR